MVAIVAGNGLGLFNTSQGLLGQSGQVGESSHGRAGDRVYVNASTGNLVVQREDEWLVGVGPDVALLRTYNSMGAGTDDNGDNWRLGVSRKILGVTSGVYGQADSVVTRVGEDGAEVAYKWDASKAKYVSKLGGGSYDTLSYSSANSTWTWVDGSTLTQETYTVVSGYAARLTSVVDTNGNKLVVNYAGGASSYLVADIQTSTASGLSGEKIEIEYYSSTSNIKAINTTYSGGISKRVSYTYDANRLATVTVDLTPENAADNTDASKKYVTTYSYVGSSKQLRSISQDDTSLLEFEYESGQIKLIKETVSAGQVRQTSFDYSTPGTTKITDNLGRQTQLVYGTSAGSSDEKQLLTIKSPGSGGQVIEQSFIYDSNGDVRQVTDGRGNTTVYEYDANGNRIYQRDAQNNVTRWNYDSSNRLMSLTTHREQAPGGTGAVTPSATSERTTWYVYDTATGKTNQARYTITADGRVTEYVYNGLGQVTSMVQYIENNLYTVSGLTRATNLPALASVNTWASTRKAKTQRTDYEYNLRGQVERQKTYDSVDSTGTGVPATARVVDFIYDQAGNLLQKIDGRGYELAYLNTTWAQTQRGELGYSADQALLTSTERKTLQSYYGAVYQFDGLNRVVSSKDPVSQQTTLTTYTDSSLQTQVTATNGLVVTSTFNRAGELISLSKGVSGELASLGTTEYMYDKLGRLITVTEPGPVKTHYLYDEAGRKVGEVDAEGALTEYSYNEAGQVIRTQRYTNKVSSAMLSQLGVSGSHAAGLPSNLISSSNNMANWTFSGPAGVTSGTSNGSVAEGTLLDEVSRWIKQTGSTSATASLSSPSVAVTPGKRYEVSVYTGVSSGSASIRLDYFNASGTNIGNSGVLDVNTTLAGGSTLASHDRLQAFVDIPSGIPPSLPAGVASVKLVVVKSAASVASHLYVTHALIAEVPAGQTQISPADLRPKLVNATDRSTYSIYDKAGRLRMTVTSTADDLSTQVLQGAVTEYRYDGAGYLVKTIGYANLLGSSDMSSLRSSKGELSVADGQITTSSGAVINLTTNAADDRVVRNIYNKDGLLRGQVDAENYYTQYDYDAAGRLARTTRYANAMVRELTNAYTLPSVGSAVPTDASLAYVLTSSDSNAASGADQVTQHLYDGRGHLVAVIDPEGHATGYTYDAAGNKTAETRYVNKAVTSSTGAVALGKSTDAGLSYYVVTTAADQRVSFKYDANNRVLRREEQPQGLVTQYEYDAASGQLLKQTTAVGVAGEERSVQKRYDKLGRLTHELGGEGSAALAALPANATAEQIEAVWKTYGVFHEYDDGGRRKATFTPQGSNDAGLKTLYYYDQVGRLTHSINALGEVVGYVYNSFGDVAQERRYSRRVSSLGSLTGGLKKDIGIAFVEHPTADAVVNNVYNRSGQLMSRTNEENTLTQYLYNAFGEQVTVYSAGQWYEFGEVLTTVSTRDRRGLVKTVEKQDASESTISSTLTNYDAFGRVTSTTDGVGNVTHRRYDKLGRMLSISTPNSTSVKQNFTYDAFSRVLTQSDFRGNANNTTFTYNDASRTMTVATLEGVSTVTHHNLHGQVVKVVDGRGHATRYTYDLDGQLLETGVYTEDTGEAISGMRESHTYDKAGRLLTTKNSQGSVTHVYYDEANRVLTRVQNEGGLNLTTEYRYDALGNAVWSRDAQGIWTETVFDKLGNVTSQTVDPALVPNSTAGSGAAGTGSNVFSKVNNPAGALALKHKTQFWYANGFLDRVIKGAGSDNPSVTAYVYDTAGRRVWETVDPDGLALTTKYVYDANDNVVARIDPLNQITRYVYNSDNQVIYTVDATGAVVKHDYDRNGRISRTVAYATRISLTGLPEGVTAQQVKDLLPASAQAGDQTTYNFYDRDGRLTRTVDALGYLTVREYDYSNNVARITRYSNALSNYNPSVSTYGDRLEFSAPGLPAADTTKDRVEQFVYDAANRLIWRVDAMGYVTQTEYLYDGRSARTTQYANAVNYPAGKTQLDIDQGIDVRNSAPTTAVTEPYVIRKSSADRVLNQSFDAIGRLRMEVDALSFATWYTYDEVGHLQTKVRAATNEYEDESDPANASTSFEHDAAGRLIKTTDAEGVVTYNEYDAANRLVNTTQAWGTSDASTTHYEYDSAGRLIAETLGHNSSDESTTQYELNALGQRVKVIDPRGVADAASHEVGSQEYQDALAAYTTTQVFDELGRIKQSTDALGGSIYTEYDAFGNAVKVTDPNNNPGYFYFDKNNQATLHVDPEGYAVETTFDAFGQVETITRFDTKITATLSTGTRPTPSPVLAKDAKTTITHDKLGRQTQIQDAELNTEYMTYDGLGNKTEYTNKLGGKFTYTHDKLGRVLTETQPVQVKELDANGDIKLTNNVATLKNVVTRFTYDSRGNVLTKVEGEGLVAQQRTTTYTYDKLNRLKTTAGEAMTVYDPVADTENTSTTPTETRWYDKRGNLIEVEAADKGRTLTYWDALNRKVGEVSPVGTLTQWDYDDAGQVIAQRIYGDAVSIDAGTRGGSRPAPVSASKVRETTYAYDANGRQTEVTLKNVTYGSTADGEIFAPITADVTTYKVYSKTGQVIQETDGRGNHTYNYYDKLGNRTLQVDAERYVSQWTYDEAGNVLTQTRYAQALPTTITVNTSSNTTDLLAAVPTPTDKRTVEFEYDRMGRIKVKRVKDVEQSTVNANTGNLNTTTADATTKFDYDALGNVTKQTDALSQVTDMAYDKQGRLTQTRTPEFVDWEGTPVRPTTDLEYNALGLQNRAIQRGKDLNAAVETDDRITVFYYGKNGTKTKEKDPEGYITSYAYDAMYRITRRDISRVDADNKTHNDRVRIVYDKAGRQTEQRVSSKLSTASNYTQLKSDQTNYNAWGDIVSKGENNGAQRKYEYDSAGRLWRSNDNENGAVKVYYYDQNGNATLELTSSTHDLMSSTVLPDNSAVSLSTLLSAKSVNSTFNLYDKINRLTDSYESSMSGVTQAASIVTETKVVSDPFAMGSMNFIPINLWGYHGEPISDPGLYGVFGSNPLVTKSKIPVLDDTKPLILNYRSNNIEKYYFYSPNPIWIDASREFVYQKISAPQNYNYSRLNAKVFEGTLFVSQDLEFGIVSYATTPAVEGSAGGVSLTPQSIARLNIFGGIVIKNLPASTFRVIYNIIAPAGYYMPTKTVELRRSTEGDFVWLYSFEMPAAENPFGYLILVDANEVSYEAFDAQGVKVAGANAMINKDAGGVPIGLYNINPHMKPFGDSIFLNWGLGAESLFKLSVHRKQVYNAYGEQIRQIQYKRNASHALEEIATDLSYNALGQLVEKKDPTVSITLQNGFQKSVRPTTRYYYDALGRLVGTTDANGNQNTQSWLAGSVAGQEMLVNEYHADRRPVEVTPGNFVAREGVKRNRYDIFGQLRRTYDERWDGVAAADAYATTYGYNKNGHLTSVNRPGQADDDYVVDSQGQRISTTLPQENNTTTRNSEKAYYDALGRITKTVTAAAVTTSYDYTWAASIAGGGGWRRTTTTVEGTLVDDTDVFGRIRWHKDLGNHAFTYRYNNAGLLQSQTSLAADGKPSDITATMVYTGQNIDFSYYGNGLVETITDNAKLTLTKYRYDDRGNRVFEGYLRNYGTLANPSPEYYQYSEAEYDDANRLVKISDPKHTINYEYDAVGNRRRVLSSYHDGMNGGLQTQDFWYAYDYMNRFTITMGKLDSAGGNTRATTEASTSVKLVVGTQGHNIGYDYDGRRLSDITATTTNGTTTTGTYSYKYDTEGYLEEVKLGANVIAFRDNDARGRVMSLQETNSTGTTRHTFTYDADNNVKTDTEEFKATAATTWIKKTEVTNTLRTSGLLSTSVNKQFNDSGTQTGTVTTTYRYEAWDDLKQKEIQVSESWGAGSTKLTYDVNGHIQRSHDVAGGRYFYYSTDADGRVLRRDEVDGPDKNPLPQNRVAAERGAFYFQNYYFFNGREVGTVSSDPGAVKKDYAQALAQNTPQAYYKRQAVSSADFDQNFMAIGSNYPGRASSIYTVATTGETLQNIALAMWGDASMWYLIAEANGLTASSELEAGQRLIIPNKVANIHNNTQTGRVYDPSQALGDISPTLPDPPPPPGKKGCGFLGILVMIVVAVVATGFVAGLLTNASGGFMSIVSQGLSTMSAGLTSAGGLGLGTAATASTAASLGATGYFLAGAAGSIASQLVGKAAGIIEHFSWKNVALGGIGSVVGGYLGDADKFMGGGWRGQAAHAATTNVITQGIGVVTGLQERFDWRGVAASAVSGGIRGLLVKNPAISFEGFQQRVGAGLLSGAASARIYGQRPDWAMIAANSFGSAIGDAVAQSIKDSDSVKTPKTFAQDVAERKALSAAFGLRANDAQTNNTSSTDPAAQDRSGKLTALKGFFYARQSQEPQLLNVAQPGGHMFLPALIAHALGISSDRMDRIIAYSQFPDQVSVLDAYTNGTRVMFTEWENYAPAAAGMFSQKALHALNGLSVKANIEFYQGIIAKYANDDAIVGIALHGLVDSIFHSRMDAKGNFVTYKAPMGHGADFSEPDYVSRDQVMIAGGQIVAAFESISGQSFTAKQLSTVNIAMNRAMDQAAALAGQEVKLFDGIQPEYRGPLMGEAPSVNANEIRELKFRDVVSAMGLRLPRVTLNALPVPFTRGPITRESTLAEGREFFSGVPTPQADALTLKGIEASTIIQKEYASRLESTGAPRVIRPDSGYDTKVWSALKFVPWFNRMPTATSR